MDDDTQRRETARVLGLIFPEVTVDEAPPHDHQHDPLAELARLIGEDTEPGYGPLERAELYRAQNGHGHPLLQVLQYRPHFSHAFFPEDHVGFSEMDYTERDK